MQPPVAPVRHPLIMEAARALGVSRWTLLRALQGDGIPHPELVSGYRDYVAAKIGADVPSLSASESLPQLHR